MQNARVCRAVETSSHLDIFSHAAECYNCLHPVCTFCMLYFGRSRFNVGFWKWQKSTVTSSHCQSVSLLLCFPVLPTYSRYYTIKNCVKPKKKQTKKKVNKHMTGELLHWMVPSYFRGLYMWWGQKGGDGYEQDSSHWYHWIKLKYLQLPENQLLLKFMACWRKE